MQEKLGRLYLDAGFNLFSRTVSTYDKKSQNGKNNIE
jgi:hypothetical protein